MASIYKKNGYKYFINSGIAVHRYVAAKKLGRSLRPGEVVHHKNRNKADNRPGNLIVYRSQKQHNATHIRSKKRFGRW